MLDRLFGRSSGYELQDWQREKGWTAADARAWRKDLQRRNAHEEKARNKVNNLLEDIAAYVEAKADEVKKAGVDSQQYDAKIGDSPNNYVGGNFGKAMCNFIQVAGFIAFSQRGDELPDSSVNAFQVVAGCIVENLPGFENLRKACEKKNCALIVSKRGVEILFNKPYGESKAYGKPIVPATAKQAAPQRPAGTTP